MNDKQIAELRATIIRARQCYYYGGNAIMSDAEYDACEAALKLNAPQDPLLGQVGAPLPSDHVLEPAEHSMPMGSQDKVNSVEDFLKWCADKPGPYHCSLKGDGGSGAAYFKAGALELAASRGDGLIGENITANAVKFKGLPAYIHGACGPFSGSIRFEAILTKADWQTVGGKNPRNQGNGIMGRKDGVQSEYITAFAFDISNGIKFKTVSEKYAYLEQLGVNVMPHRLCQTPQEVIEYYTMVMAARGGRENSGTLPIWVDGIVCQLDDLAAQDKLGYAPSGKYHKAQTAWKPEQEGVETILRSYEITGGHTGALVPNARYDPVQFGGTTISNALLNNWDEIARLDVAVGDTIIVTKANDIVPKVLGVAKKVYTCPECGFKGSLEEQQKHHSAT